METIATTMKAPGEALAERLGTTPVRFRGDHDISARPAAFAATLDEVLRNDA